MNKDTKETGDINCVNGIQLLYLKKGKLTRKLCWYFSKLKMQNEEWLSVQASNEQIIPHNIPDRIFLEYIYNSNWNYLFPPS